MREFEHFPEEATCPICNTNNDAPCFMAGIDGTQKENIEEAQLIHTHCLTADGARYRYNKEIGIIYRFL